MHHPLGTVTRDQEPKDPPLHPEPYRGRGSDLQAVGDAVGCARAGNPDADARSNTRTHTHTHSYTNANTHSHSHTYTNAHANPDPAAPGARRGTGAGVAGYRQP